MSMEMTTQEYVAELIKKARVAQKVANGYSQERVIELARVIALTAIKNAETWAKMALEETDMGEYNSKVARLNDRPRGTLRDLLNGKTVGVIEDNPETGIMKIAKPVGVIGGITPTTVPEVAIVVKSMNALACRNAIVFSPHPKAKKISLFIVEELRNAIAKFGAPADLIQCIEDPTKEASQELMSQCDLVIATGGSGLVKAAYSSGKPAYGVGTGNVVSVIDETANLQDAAHKIMESQTNDWGTGCSTENSLVIQESVYDDMIKAMAKEGGVLLSSEDKKKLQDVMWIDGHLNGKIICRAPQRIADAAGIKIPEGTNFILVEEDGIGKEHPYSGEKLSVVLTVYKYKDFDDAIKLVNDIQAYMGAGHSCGIHSFNEEHIMKLASETRTSRVMINTPQNKANAGNWKNGMPFTITLACGTWGGNITTENIHYKHYMNVTWVARWFDDRERPSDEFLFGNMLGKV